MNVTVLRESWQPHPLAWIHRAEARFFAKELRRAGYATQLVRFRDADRAETGDQRILFSAFAWPCRLGSA